MIAPSHSTCLVMIGLISLPQLLQATTKQAATQAILDVATAIGFDVTSWQTNRAGRTLIAILATIYAGFTTIVVSFAAAGGYLSTASASWLQLLAQELFGVSWNPAAYATGSVTLTNTSAVPYTFSPGGLTFTYAPGGSVVPTSFVNTYSASVYGNLPGLATLPANSSIVIPVVALLSGSAGGAAGNFTAMSPAFLGVTFANSPILGTDAESDVALRARCDAKRGALSPNGAPGAYAYWAQSIRLDANGNPLYPPPVTDQATYDAGVPLDVNRVKVTINNTIGTVIVYLGGSGGAATAPVVTIVHYALQTWVVPAGITETTGLLSGPGCFTLAVNIAYSAELDPAYGVSIADAESAIQAAIVAYFGDPQRNPIGGKSKTYGGVGYLYVNILESVIGGALPAAGLPPAALITANITAPAADVPLLVFGVPVLATLGTITPSVSLVAQN